MPPNPAKGWSFRFSDLTPPLKLYEREDRGGELYLTWPRGRTHARPKLKGLDSVRDAHGRLDPERVGRALELGLAQYRRALALATEEKVAEPPPLTLSQGFARAMAFPAGLYPSRTPSWFEARRAQGRILAALGEETPWASLRPPEVRTLWREAARRFQETREGGPGAAETDVKVLAKVANWLVDAGELRQAVRLPRGWRSKLLEDWAHITGDRSVVSGPRRPRYSQAEMSLIFANVHLAAPQLALLVTLAGELRGGQVLRCHRTHLTLDRGGIGFGQLEVVGQGQRKPGGIVMLDRAQRAAVDEVLGRGYLSRLEAAYRAGTLEDYPLFPALRGGGPCVPIRPRLKPMNRSALQALMRDYELALGIPHVPGRLMHGLRRAISDALKAAPVVDAVKDAAAGWTPGSGTREKVYEEAERTWERQEAAHIRAHVRQGRAEEPRRAEGGAPASTSAAPGAHPDSAPSVSAPHRGDA